MKNLRPLVVSCLLSLASLVLAADIAAPAKDKPADKPAADKTASATPAKTPAPDAAWLAKAVAAYPLATCVVGGDKLGGDMGAPVDHVFKQTGQPDRLVRFCCMACLPDFEKEPAKFLKLIDDAAAAKEKKN